MNWIQNKQHPVYEYRLETSGDTLQTMRFDYRQNTYTAYCAGKDGDFVIDRLGFWKSKIVLRENEVIIGKLYPENWYSNNGIAEIKGEKLIYRIVNNPLAEIQFLHQGNLLIACGIKPQNSKLEVGITTASHFDKHPFAKYLTALSWYLMLPSVQEDVMDFIL